jgi:flagellar hook assembly protein FlgD
LTSIGGDLSITTNNSLAGLDELSGLTEIPFGFYLFGNALLEDLWGLHNISSVGDDFYIQLTKLTDLAGFESLTTIGGNMNISYNDSLVNMAGFTNLTTINGSFWFEFDRSLTNLEGLESLKYVNSFRINSNEKLESLSGIQNINPDSLNSFVIRNNDMLSYCAVESVCQHLLNPGENTKIKFNTTGCNSIEEVLEECSVSINDVSQNQRVKTYPNPFSTYVSFEYIHHSSSGVTVTIFNSLGKQVKSIELHQPAGTQTISWDAEGMPSGIYSFTLLADEKMVSGKLILVD